MVKDFDPKSDYQKECAKVASFGNDPMIQEPNERLIADNTYSYDSKPMRRFYLERVKDETGISRTGRVLEGAQLQSGRVIAEWRPPLTSIAIYGSMKEFMAIHVDCHPSCNNVIWVDDAL